MPVRRLIARAPLDSLVSRFEEIRAGAGIVETRSPAVAQQVRDVGSAQGELPHVDDDRHDATDVPLVTIDPVGAMDLDQALHIEPHGTGWIVHYAIADVGAHVAPGSPLDHDTRGRAETVYCPDKRVGLHPPELAEGFASLRPGQRTKAALWTLDVASDGGLASAAVRRAWVESRHQYSYVQLHELPPAAARPLIDHLAAVGAARRALLRTAGAVTLPKPSQEVVNSGGGLSLEFRAGLPIEDDNAQISLLTGMAAAQLMISAGVGVLRTMPRASEAAMARLRHQASALGVEWGEDEDYATVLDHLDPASPQGAAFLVQAVTLFRGARWEPFDTRAHGAGIPLPDHLEHGALAAPYAHVTAPLRRLVDRFGTEVCLATSAGRPVPAWVTEALPTLGEAMAAGVGRNSRVDRDCVDAVEGAVLAPHVGEHFDAIGLDDRTVQLREPAVVARCDGEVIPGHRLQARLVDASIQSGARFAA